MTEINSQKSNIGDPHEALKRTKIQSFDHRVDNVYKYIKGEIKCSYRA